MVSPWCLPNPATRFVSRARPGEVETRATGPVVLQSKRTFADNDEKVADLEAEAIIDAADEVELMLRALNAMVPVPKRRRTRERLPDAEDDVARGGAKEEEGGREGEKETETERKG